MSYKCKDCEMLKLSIEWGFANGVCNNIYQHTICNNCNRIIKKNDNMNNKDIDIINNKIIDDDLDIFVFIEMNNLVTIKGFDNLLESNDEGYNNDYIFKYYNIIKQLYNMLFYINFLKYIILFDYLNEFLNNQYKIHELRHTIKHMIGIMEMFRKQIKNKF